MQLSISIKDYDNENIVFSNKTDNNVISGGNFYRLMYCTKDISMLGVHILFEIDMSFNCQTNNYDIKDITNKLNNKIISIISPIINQIHNKWVKEYNKINKNMNPITVYNIEQSVNKAVEAYKSQIKKGIKIIFILKCSGIYETEYESGVSFRLNYC
jgi:hypothetical protein